MQRVIAHERTDQPYDLLVIGAGINGAGIARDAAMRGLRVLLVDKGDIGGGTTSWSTRLIHGGLRYLEHYEIDLVRESLRERERLLRIAPHLVHPLGFLIPIYKGDGRGPALIRLGMIAYDILSFDKSLPRHRMLNRKAALSQEPGLAPEGLRGAAFYYDGQVEYPERIAVENALSAHDAGALVLTYEHADDLLVEGGRVVGARLRHEETGAISEVRASLTINVSGPWVDEVLEGQVSLPEKRFIGGTKGTHIVVSAFPGAPKTALYVQAGDGRPYFIVPWNDLFLIGTTDTRYRGDLDHVEASEDEIEYLLRETNRVIPGAGLERGDVRYTYSGVRPLPEQQEGQEGGITRRHVIKDHAPHVEGLISIIGGKLTTYRNLARQTVDAVYEKLGRKAPQSRTGDVPLPGGAVGGSGSFEEFAAQFKVTGGLTDELASRLLKLYGGRAPEVLAEAGEDHSLRVPLSPEATVETGLIGAEVLYAFRRELAEKIGDVLLRRSMVGMGPRVALDVDEAAVRVAVQHLGWSEERAEREVAEFRDYVRRYKPKDFRETGSLKV